MPLSCAHEEIASRYQCHLGKVIMKSSDMKKAAPWHSLDSSRVCKSNGQFRRLGANVTVDLLGILYDKKIVNTANFFIYRVGHKKCPHFIVQ